MPRDTIHFCSSWEFLHRGEGGRISQQVVIFVEEGIVATFSQLRNEGMELQNGTRVPRGGFAVVKPPAKWGLSCEIWDFKAWRISQPFRSWAMSVRGCEMALVCQRDVSQRGIEGCDIILQREAIFAADAWGLRNYFTGALFRLRNFADHAFSLFLSSS